MTDLYRVHVDSITPAKGRARPVVSLHVLQIASEGGLRTIYVDQWQRFAGRLLLDSGLPELSTVKDPFAPKARFPQVMKAVLRNVVSHDLIDLIDRDRAKLARLIELTGWDTLDPAEYLRTYGEGEPVRRDERAHYSNYLDEGTLDVSLKIEPPPGLTVGMSWKSAAFGA